MKLENTDQKHGPHRWDRHHPHKEPRGGHPHGGMERRDAHRGDDLLKVEDLSVVYTAGKKIVRAVNGVSFEIKRGESLALVGESGCGKSTIAKAILRILPDRGAGISGGKILFEGQDLATLPEKEMQHIRGDKISMVFQDPMTALNPTMRVGDQIADGIALHDKLSKQEAEQKAMEILEMVGISRERYREYPHQFSGGMKQRVVIAIALACNPDLLLADEPTTALDVTIQAQVLDLINALKKKNNTAMLLITHDLGVVAETCDDVAVVYAGEIVESGSREEIFTNPMHPYLIGLFGSLPDMCEEGATRLKPIAGMMPNPSNLPSGCKFHLRCHYATEACKAGAVELADLGGTHKCRCLNIDAVRAGKEAK